MKDLAALEEKCSLLQSELVVKRQTLEKLQLQKDLLEQEKDEFAMALEKVWTPTFKQHLREWECHQDHLRCCFWQ